MTLLWCGDETHLQTRTAVVSDVHTTRDQRHDNSRYITFFFLLSSYIVDFVILCFLTTPPHRISHPLMLQISSPAMINHDDDHNDNNHDQ